MNQRSQSNLNATTPLAARNDESNSFGSTNPAESFSQTQLPGESLEDYYKRLGEKSDREDLVMFINACFAATRQNEYYTDRFEQSVSIDFLHRYVMTNYRRTYARALSAGINHFNQAQVIFNLLQSGAPADHDLRTEEGNLIASALKRLPPNRVFGLFRLLKGRRVNNRRTRAVIKKYLNWRREPEFDAVKYRRKYRAAASHAHVKLPAEFGAFLFDFQKTKSFETELFDDYKKAHYSAATIYNLPFTVAESLAAKHEVPREVFFRKIEHKMTAAEKLRFQTASAKGKGTKVELDLSRARLTRLAIYVLSLSPKERIERADELSAAFEASARRAISYAPLKLGRVAAVLDRSRSSIGSKQKRNRPLAVALATNELLKQASNDYQAFWTIPIDGDHEFMVTPKGQTSLAETLIDALQWKPDLLLLVSDGYENDPPDAANQIVRVYQEKIAKPLVSSSTKGEVSLSDGSQSDSKKAMPEIIHLNPVFDSDHFSPKPLGAAIPTVGIRDAEDVATMLGFARFASGSAKLEVLESHLERLSRDFVKGKQNE